MVVTREWLESVIDEQGLTRGQQQLLKIHMGDSPYVGRLLDDQIGKVIQGCKGYRGPSEEFKAMRGQF